MGKSVRLGFMVLLGTILLLSGCGWKMNNSVSERSGDEKDKKHEAIDYPPWILNPTMDGCLGAVGVAKKQNSAARSRQWVAEKVAMAELSRQFEVLVESICRSKETANFSDELMEKYEKEVECISRQESEHLFSIYTHDPVVKARWIDPVNGDMYVWVVLPVTETR
ncbi:MAG: hypothetical protein ACOC90_00025 [Bacteroidota bacterium]